MQSLVVTAESLAASAGVPGLQDPHPDLDSRTRSHIMSIQLGSLQRQPMALQRPIHFAIAAKYLPTLLQLYMSEEGVVNPPMTLINVISYSPYFVTFSRTQAAKGLAATQLKRTLTLADSPVLHVDIAGESSQFLATLLLLQGVEDIPDEDIKAVIPIFKTWESVYVGRLEAETSERCMGLLSKDPELAPLFTQVRKMLEKDLVVCGAPQCGRRKQVDGGQLLRWSRCKSAVYKLWATHKTVCFAPVFHC